MNFRDLGTIGGWTMLMMTYNENASGGPGDDEWYVVGTGHNVGVRKNLAFKKWDYFPGSKDGYIGKWQFKMIAFDGNDNLWGVGTGSNLGLYDPETQKMINKKNPGGWKLKMVTIDKVGTMWAVNDQGTLGKYDDSNDSWTSYPEAGVLEWAAFRPGDSSDEIYCITTNNELIKFELDHKEPTIVPTNVRLLSLHFISADYACAVGTNNQAYIFDKKEA